MGHYDAQHEGMEMARLRRAHGEIDLFAKMRKGIPPTDEQIWWLETKVLEGEEARKALAEARAAARTIKRLAG